ncbi:MAG: M23 family metallopeptidase [Defluviitaleaceae bacterium]|nr:M23 family metallopeptidase [Defluviitaleaceae bacterium]
MGIAEESAFYYPEPPLWLNPVTGRISSPAGTRYSPITGHVEFHDGVDIAIPVGTPIVAPKDGSVVAAGYSPSFGHFLRIAHANGYTSFYAHLSRFAVTIGDVVRQGYRVAYSGNTGMSTGPHLHFGIFHEGQFIDPITRLDFQP